MSLIKVLEFFEKVLLDEFRNVLKTVKICLKRSIFYSIDIEYTMDSKITIFFNQQILLKISNLQINQAQKIWKLIGFQQMCLR
jgi:hypothetical protein